MNSKIKELKEGDFREILSINNAVHPEHIHFTQEILTRLERMSCYFKGIQVEGELAGFVLAMREGNPYKSLNYLWFSERLPKFIYIDRVSFLPKFQGAKLSHLLYKDLISFSEMTELPLVCEISCNPPNKRSLKFHSHFGFIKEMGRRRESESCELVMLQREMR